MPSILASALYPKGVPGGPVYDAWEVGGGVIVEISAEPDRSRVEYTVTRRIPGQDVQEVAHQASVTWSLVGNGGCRAWLHCTRQSCHRRAPRLYLVGADLFCRVCAGIRYESKNRTPLLRARVSADRLRVRLGAEMGPDALLPYSKPKGMHWSTYDRLFAELLDAEACYRELLRPVVDKHQARARLVGTMVSSADVPAAYPSLRLLLIHRLEARRSLRRESASCDEPDERPEGLEDSDDID